MASLGWLATRLDDRCGSVFRRCDDWYFAPGAGLRSIAATRDQLRAGGGRRTTVKSISARDDDPFSDITRGLLVVPAGRSLVGEEDYQWAAATTNTSDPVTVSCGGDGDWFG